MTDGSPCKQRGARSKRDLVEDEDGALKACDQLRGRMYARLLRWQDAALGERAGQTIWQERVAGDISADSETCCPEAFQCLDLRVPDAKWEVYTADDRRQEGKIRIGHGQNKVLSDPSSDLKECDDLVQYIL